MTLKLSQRLEELAHAFEGRKEMTLKEAVEAAGSESQALITLLFSLPFVFCLPLPGLSMVFGAAILLNGVRIARKKAIWLPKKMGLKKVSGDSFAKQLRRPIGLLKKTERWIHPRGTIFQRHPAVQIVNGWFLAAAGFFLLLPLPPGTNFLPGLAVFFLSLGILEEDIACIWIGYMSVLANIALLVFIPLLFR